MSLITTESPSVPDVAPTTAVNLDWSAFVGPALVAALITALVTVALHISTVRRENRHRFTADKRSAYSELIASFVEAHALINFDEVQDGEALIKATQKMLQAGPSPELLRIVVEEHKTNVRRTQDRAYAVRDRTAAAYSVVVLLGPASVQVAAEQVINAFADPKRQGSTGMTELGTLLQVLRADLGMRELTTSSWDQALSAFTQSGTKSEEADIKT